MSRRLRQGATCIACVLVSLLVVAVCGCTKSTAVADAASDLAVVPIEVDLTPVTRSSLVATVELVGNLTPYRRVVIAPEVDGTILEIPASQRQRIEADIAGEHISEAPRLDIGVAVAKGDVLVRLDPSEYRLKCQAAQARVDLANAELKKLKAWQRTEEVRRAKASKDQAEAGVVLAQANLGRAKQLFERQAIAESEYDSAMAEADVAQATLERARADFELTQAGPTVEELAIADAAVQQAMVELERAKWEFDRTVIYAPYDGVVTDRYVDEGDRVTAAPRVDLMELLDLSVMTAQFGVPERYIGQIHVGDEAEVHVTGSVAPLPGLVALINDKVDPTSRTFRTRIALRNEDRRLKAGQFVRVVLPVRRTTMALTVPARAITHAGGEAQVFVFADGRVRQQPVVLGIANDAAVEVLSGVTEGQQVVVDDPSILSDGMAVRLREAAEAYSAPGESPGTN